jgi:hypothetical protein
MKILRTLLVLVAASFVAGAFAQSWNAAYEAGLRAAQAGDWAGAREAFQQAAAYRTEDVAQATLLPGPPTERRRWRDGRPYSPNFLAAYAAYKLAMRAPESAEGQEQFAVAAQELESLLERGQHSRETYFILNDIYTRTRQVERRQALEERLRQQPQLAWRVDTEVMPPDELALIHGTAPVVEAVRTPRGGAVPTLSAGDLVGGRPPIAGTVAALPNKFALVVGNSECRISGDAGVPFASDDAQRIREALVANGGYMDENVELVINATAQQMMTTARALADRMSSDATVLIYFAGCGVNVNGRDFLAGIDAEVATDTNSMVGKNDLFRLFMARGASVFAFFQTNRLQTGGRFFGSEIPMVGSIAQVQATLPGETVSAIVRQDRTVGVFTEAMTNVIEEMRTNRIPITEFGWQVFYRMRRGGTGEAGGSSRQTPTLPVLTNMASDARF